MFVLVLQCKIIVVCLYCQTMAIVPLINKKTKSVMGYTLKPVNKKCFEEDFGAFIWPIMLQDTGMGYVLGYGAAKDPAQYVYDNGNFGSPVSNDGYKVTASEAKAMAKVARGYVSVKRFINKQWDELDEETKERCKNLIIDGKHIYKQRTSDSFIDCIERFAEFAEKSGGFKIR